MILADTSVWIDQGQIAIRPFIIAELALRSLRERKRTLASLDLLPQAQVAQLSEVRQMIERRRMYGLGLGLVDAHLIASIFISSPMRLWTRDKQLREVAENLGIGAGLA